MRHRSRHRRLPPRSAVACCSCCPCCLGQRGRAPLSCLPFPPRPLPTHTHNTGAGRGSSPPPPSPAVTAATPPSSALRGHLLLVLLSCCWVQWRCTCIPPHSVSPAHSTPHVPSTGSVSTAQTSTRRAVGWALGRSSRARWGGRADNAGGARRACNTGGAGRSRWADGGWRRKRERKACASRAGRRASEWQGEQPGG